jgi:hypothetical protein
MHYKLWTIGKQGYRETEAIEKANLIKAPYIPVW